MGAALAQIFVELSILCFFHTAYTGTILPVRDFPMFRFAAFRALTECVLFTDY